MADARPRIDPGLSDEQRVEGVDPIGHLRRLHAVGDMSDAALADLEARVDRPSLHDVLLTWLGRTPIDGSLVDADEDEAVVAAFVDGHLSAMRTHADEVIARMVAVGQGEPEALERRMSAGVEGAASFLRPDGAVNRAHAGLLFIESHRHLPLLAWPRRLIDTVVEVEQSMLAFRHAHARMVERMIGRRMGTGGQRALTTSTPPRNTGFSQNCGRCAPCSSRKRCCHSRAMRLSTASQARNDSRVVRVDVDGDELVLVLVERDLERVEDEADVRFFVAVEGDQFLAEGLTEVVFLGKRGAPMPIWRARAPMMRARSKRVWSRAGLTMGCTCERTRKPATNRALLKTSSPHAAVRPQPSSSDGARRLCLMLRHSMTLAGAQAATNAPVKSASCRPSRGFVAASAGACATGSAASSARRGTGSCKVTVHVPLALPERLELTLMSAPYGPFGAKAGLVHDVVFSVRFDRPPSVAFRASSSLRVIDSPVKTAYPSMTMAGRLMSP